MVCKHLSQWHCGVPVGFEKINPPKKQFFQGFPGSHHPTMISHTCNLNNVKPFHCHADDTAVVTLQLGFFASFLSLFCVDGCRCSLRRPETHVCASGQSHLLRDKKGSLMGICKRTVTPTLSHFQISRMRKMQFPSSRVNIVCFFLLGEEGAGGGSDPVFLHLEQQKTINRPDVTDGTKAERRVGRGAITFMNSRDLWDQRPEMEL